MIIREVKVTALTDAQRFFDDNKEKLKNAKSLISRLESFVEISNAEDEFGGMVSALRKTATDKLERWKMKNTSFFEFLKEKRGDYTKLISSESLKYLDNEDMKNAYNPTNDNGFLPSLYKYYYLAFLPAVRKFIKAEEKTSA